VEVLLIACGSTQAQFAKALGNSNWRLESAASPDEAMGRLRESPKAVVICEDPAQETALARADTEAAGTPTGPWLDLLSEARRLKHPPKVIVASREAGDRLWAEVLHQGGYDVLPLPLEAPEVLRLVSTAWLEWRREEEVPLRAMAAAG
jgi:DNA-binding NtrC family response regulator